MLRALITGLIAACVVFISGVLLGWPYALFLGFVILLAINLVNMRKGN